MGISVDGVKLLPEILYSGGDGFDPQVFFTF